MEILVKFKNELKQSQMVDRKILKQLELEIDLARKKFVHIVNISPEKFKSLFPVLYKEILLTEEYKNYVINSKDIFKLDLNKLLEDILKSNRAFYNRNQVIINALDNDKVINYIDIERLLMHLATSKMSIEETFQIFKMVIEFDADYLKRKKCTSAPNLHYVLLLSHFFIINDDFQTDKNVNEFKIILEEIFLQFKDSYKLLLNDGLICEETFDTLMESCDKLINGFTNLLVIFYDTQQQSNRITKNVFKTKDAKTEKNYYVELRKYYKNGIVLLIPENLDEFIELLDLCGIDKKEKSIILKQINQKIEELKEEKLLDNLSAFDKVVFNKALRKLETYDDPFIHKYVRGLLNDIMVYLELLTELYNKDSFGIKERIEETEIYSQIEALLYEIRKSLDLNINNDFDNHKLTK